MFRKNALTYNVTLSFSQGTLEKLGLKVGGGGGGGKGEIWKIVGISGKILAIPALTYVMNKRSPFTLPWDTLYPDCDWPRRRSRDGCLLR